MNRPEGDAENPDRNIPPNIIVLSPRVQPAATFGSAVAGLALNYAASNFSLPTLNGADGKTTSTQVSSVQKLTPS